MIDAKLAIEIGGILITLGIFIGMMRALSKQFTTHAADDKAQFQNINEHLSENRESLARIEGYLKGTRT